LTFKVQHCGSAVSNPRRLGVVFGFKPVRTYLVGKGMLASRPSSHLRVTTIFLHVRFDAVRCGDGISFSSFVRSKGKSDDIVRLARAVEFGSLGGAERKLSKSGGPATRESRRLPSSNRFRTAAAHIATGETAMLPALTWREFVLFRDSTCLCYWRLLHATTALDRARAAVAHGASAVVRFWSATFQSCFTMLADFALHWHAPLT